MNRNTSNSAITSVSYVLVGFLSLIVAFPLFIFFHRQLPDYEWPFHSDRILMFLFVIVFSLLVLRLFRPLIIIGMLITFGWLGYGSLTGKYGFENLVSDYKAMMYAIRYEPGWEKIPQERNKTFPYKNLILKAADSHDEAVRNFAVSAANKYFKKEQKHYEYSRQLIQCFAVFKVINEGWNYVNDPEEGEYFAPAAESAKLLAGDCDDYAILMVASIRAIGGEARFIRTTDHLYPEMKLGSSHELEMANYLIKRILFHKESRTREINYHRDVNGSLWLNLDYTADYPGGKFLAPEVLGVLTP